MFRRAIAVFGILASFAAADSSRAQQTVPPVQNAKVVYSAWTRSCTREADVGGRQICFATKVARTESGRLATAAIVVEREGETRKTLRVLLPLGMQTAFGTRVIVDSEKPVVSPYLFCAAEGCVSDYDATPDLVGKLRTGERLVVQAINAAGAPVSLPLPLAEFDQAFSAAPIDWSQQDGQLKKILPALFKIKSEPASPPSSPSLRSSPWTKSCLRAQDAEAKQVCFTKKDGLTESGAPVAGVVVIEPEGKPKNILRVTIPTGVNIAPGTRLFIDSGPPATSAYLICFANGCMSDYELTPALLASLRSGRSITVQAIANTGRAISIALPLDDFNKAHDGGPTDQKKPQQDSPENASREKLPNSSHENDALSKAPEHATVTPPGPAAAAFGRRIALVIGNSAYQYVPALPNPRRDAAIVADALRQADFQVVTLRNDLGREQLIDALRDFAKQAEGADWAVVYYAGHGMEVAGVNYLVPVDARIRTDRDINLEAVSIDQVLNAVERAKQLRIVLLDACRDNPFASQMKRTMTLVSRSVTRGLAQMEPDPGTLVVFAAKHGETALDGDAVNSPFALAFVKNMRIPGLEVRRLFDNVRDDVLEMTGRQQQPYSYGSITGRQDFYFTAAR